MTLRNNIHYTDLCERYCAGPLRGAFLHEISRIFVVHAQKGRLLSFLTLRGQVCAPTTASPFSVFSYSFRGSFTGGPRISSMATRRLIPNSHSCRPRWDVASLLFAAAKRSFGCSEPPATGREISLLLSWRWPAGKNRPARESSETVTEHFTSQRVTSSRLKTKLFETFCILVRGNRRKIEATKWLSLVFLDTLEICNRKMECLWKVVNCLNKLVRLIIRRPLFVFFFFSRTGVIWKYW